MRDLSVQFKTYQSPNFVVVRICRALAQSAAVRSCGVAVYNSSTHLHVKPPHHVAAFHQERTLVLLLRASTASDEVVFPNAPATPLSTPLRFAGVPSSLYDGVVVARARFSR